MALVLAIASVMRMATGATAQATEPPAPPSATRAESPQPPQPPQPAQPPAGAGPVSAPPVLVPPSALETPAPTPPDDYAARGEEPSVELALIVLPDASISGVEAAPNAPAALAALAVEAVHRWRFTPATRDGVPIAARIRVRIQFRIAEMVTTAAPPREASAPLDVVTTEEGHAPPSEADEVDGSSSSPAPESAQVDVHGEHGEHEEEEWTATAEVDAAPLRMRDRGPADYSLERDALPATPTHDAGDLLRGAPGVFIARPEGDAVGHRVMLRGFDAEHGQDIEFRLEGVPLNRPSHLHGQGYTDLGLIIPELVSAIRVTEGVYDPRQGDFAVAGSVDFSLGVAERGVALSLQAGSFRTVRTLAILAPEGMPEDTFAAVAMRRTDGFGEQRSGRSATAMAQLGFDVGGFHMHLLSTFHGARASLAGVVREDDVREGRVGFYDAYDLATAEAQSASSLHAGISLRGQHRGRGDSNAEFLLWFGFDDFRLQENFTGFTQRSTINPAWVGRGDLIEQQNRTLDLGASFRYRSQTYRPLPAVGARLEAGMVGRVTRIEQSQNLIEAPNNQTWDRRVDTEITAGDIGVFVDLGLDLGPRFSLHAGVRADMLTYGVSDALGNFIPAFRSESFVPGYRRSASGVAAGPRVSAKAELSRDVHLLAAYGEGFRSPQARTLDDGERAPFTKVRSADLGLRVSVLDERLILTGSGFLTQLSDDVAFEASEGRLEPLAATRRLGATLHLLSRPAPWLVASTSLTYVHATLREDPPTSLRDPDPPLSSGDRLPFVPPWVFRADLSARHVLTELAGHPLGLSAGVGLGVISARPLPFSGSTPAFAVLDASVAFNVMQLELGFSLQNLTGARYAASAYHFVSNWEPNAASSRVPVTHTSAAAPRTFSVTLGGRL